MLMKGGASLTDRSNEQKAKGEDRTGQKVGRGPEAGGWGHIPLGKVPHDSFLSAAYSSSVTCEWLSPSIACRSDAFSYLIPAYSSLSQGRNIHDTMCSKTDYPDPFCKQFSPLYC